MLGFFLEPDQLSRLVGDFEPLQLGAGVALGASAALVLGRKGKSPERVTARMVPDFAWDIVLLDGQDAPGPMSEDQGWRALRWFAGQHLAKIADLIMAMHAGDPVTRVFARTVGELDKPEDPLMLIVLIGADEMAFTLTVDQIVHGSLWARLFLRPSGDPSGDKAAYWALALGLMGMVGTHIGSWSEPDVQHDYVCYLNATWAAETKSESLASITSALKVEEPGDKDSIKKIQICLSDLGFDVGKADGEMGPKFRRGTRDLVEALNTTPHLSPEELWGDQPFVSMFVQYTQEQYQSRLAAAIEADQRFAGMKAPFT